MPNFHGGENTRLYVGAGFPRAYSQNSIGFEELLKGLRVLIVFKFPWEMLYLGEQPVGISFIIETHYFKHPFLAHTPTLRVPMSVAGTDIPYITMWAMLLALRRYNQQAERKIESVVCPGLETGIGRVSCREAARQIALAYDHFLYSPKSLNCFVSAERQLPI